jgi:hypothetical protein
LGYSGSRTDDSGELHAIRFRRRASRIGRLGEVGMHRIVFRCLARDESVALSRIVASVLGEWEDGRITTAIRCWVLDPMATSAVSLNSVGTPWCFWPTARSCGQSRVRSVVIRSASGAARLDRRGGAGSALRSPMVVVGRAL